MICFCDEACLGPSLPLNAACQNKSAHSCRGHPTARGSLHIHSVSFASVRLGRGGQPRPLSPAATEGLPVCWVPSLPGCSPLQLLRVTCSHPHHGLCSMPQPSTQLYFPLDPTLCEAPLHPLPPPWQTGACSDDAGRSPGLALGFIGLRSSGGRGAGHQLVFYLGRGQELNRQDCPAPWQLLPCCNLPGTS